jgi:uncharacterized membrane protein YwzB
MKRLFIICLTLIIILLFIGLNPINASKFGEGLSATGTLAYPGTSPSLTTTIANLVNRLLTFLGVVFVGLIIYGGFSYLTSGGSEEKIKKGKNTLKAAVIGLIIIMTGYTVTYFIATSLESPGTTPGGGGPTFMQECEDSTEVEYFSLNCCEYRFQKSNSVDQSCCNLYSDFCNHHELQCAPQLNRPTCS